MTNSGTPVSEGYLLIDRNNWNEFIGIFDTTEQRFNKISIIVSRSLNTPFLQIVNQGYSLIDNHCSIAVQKSLNAIGVKTHAEIQYTPIGSSSFYTKRVNKNPYWPSEAYKAIKKCIENAYTRHLCVANSKEQDLSYVK